MGVQDAGIFGDILCVRMAKRGVVGLVTDGMIRDKVGVLESRLPVWCGGVAAPSSVNGLTFVGWEQPIGCGGVAVFPGDVIVGDGDGVICIPADAGRACRQGGPGAGTVRGLGRHRGREGQLAAGPLSAQRREQGRICGVARQALTLTRADVLRRLQARRVSRLSVQRSGSARAARLDPDGDAFAARRRVAMGSALVLSGACRLVTARQCTDPAARGSLPASGTHAAARRMASSCLAVAITPEVSAAIAMSRSSTRRQSGSLAVARWRGAIRSATGLLPAAGRAVFNKAMKPTMRWICCSASAFRARV